MRFRSIRGRRLAETEQVGEQLTIARLRLALAHLAGDRIPEVAAKVPEAEAFFAERGAASWVATYRASARRPARQPGTPGGAAETREPDQHQGARETVGGSSGSVRSTG